MQLIEDILRAAGEMPDPAAHRRYLEKLSTEELQARLETLRETPGVGTWPTTVRFWTRAAGLAKEEVRMKNEEFQPLLPCAGARMGSAGGAPADAREARALPQ